MLYTFQANDEDIMIIKDIIKDLRIEYLNSFRNKRKYNTQIESELLEANEQLDRLVNIDNSPILEHEMAILDGVTI